MKSPVEHRPWPLPQGPWVMKQTWLDLLFAHWPVLYEHLRGMIPPGMELQTYDGYAWIGIVPFHMSNIRMRGLPPIPYTSAFEELNVRTYVTVGDPAWSLLFQFGCGEPACGYDGEAMVLLALLLFRNAS